MFIKISEIKAMFKSLCENGLNKEQAVIATEKAYTKKGFSGDFVLTDENETCAFSDLEFDEVAPAAGTKTEKSFDAASAKSIADLVTRTIKETHKALIPAVAKDPTEEARGFYSGMGELIRDTVQKSQGVISPKLKAWMDRTEKSSPSVAMGESTAAAGGVFVPPVFLNQVKQYDDLEGIDLMSECDNLPMSGNAITLPINQEAPWNGGVQAYFQSELATINQVAPLNGSVSLMLNDLTCLVPMSNNLMEDSPAASALAINKIRQALRWKWNDSIINGSGAGMPQGILKSGALLVVPKTSGQAAGTITYANVTAMESQTLPNQEYAWFITPKGRQQLWNMVLPGGLAPGASNLLTGFSGKMFKTLLGFPIVPMQELPALGQQGDIMLVNMKGYLAASKEVQMASSIHLFFDTNATALRAVSRVDGKPWASKPVTSAKDPTFFMSQFITLAARQ